MTDLERVKQKLADRYQENFEFFKTAMPSIHKIVQDCRSKSSLNIDPKTGRVNLFIEGENPYPGDALDHSIIEVREFSKLVNSRNYRPNPYDLKLSHLIQKNPFHRTVSEYSKNYILSKSSLPHYLDCVIFGSGLGYHIEALVNKKLFQHHTVIENNIDYFISSMYTCNWKSITSSLENGQSLSILLKPKDVPDEEFDDHISWHFSQQFPANANSTLIYNHLEAKRKDEFTSIKEMISSYSNYIRVSYERLGPDCQRLMNAIENTKQKKPIIDLDNCKAESEKTKIAIVGAGPSLDIYMDQLKTIRSKLIVVSCGSALSSLVKNGIKPDFHFELEFLNLATDIIEDIAKSIDIKDITLLSSYEGNPGYSKFFKNVYQFVQETNELVNNMETNYVLRFGGLTCTNGATALFSRMLNNDIIFFGLDFAFTNNQHHAKDNITNQKNLPENLQELERFGEALKNRKDLIVKTTTGEDVYTTISFNSARMLMERLISISNNQYFNCSKGAAISGAEYLTQKEILEWLEASEDAKEIDIKSVILNHDQIRKIGYEILQTSLEVSEKYLIEIYKFREVTPQSACIRIVNLIKSTSSQLSRHLGQNRSIMSFNRLPLLLLFNAINFCHEDQYHDILEAWIKDYEEYLTFVKEKLLTPFERDDFYIREEWLDQMA